MESASQTRTAAASLRALLTGLIDYAGIFPPASLDMRTAVAKYAEYLSGEYRWALGRFVVPANRLGEFKQEQIGLITPEFGSTVLATALEGFEGLAHNFHKAAQGKSEHFPWHLSAIIGADVEAELKAVSEFNAKNSGKAIVDVVEIKAPTVDEIRVSRQLVPPGMMPYFEINADSGPEIFYMLKAVNSRAKMRTGGVVESAFPAAEQIAQFIVRCAEAKLPFKATAGLHHPLRCVKPLTYQANGPKGRMHGFLNVFLAACAYGELSEGVDSARRGYIWNAMLAMLTNEAPANFIFHDDKVTMRGMLEEVSEGRTRNLIYELTVSTETIRRARENSAISFGSCSFEEPIEDLRSFQLL